MAIGPKARNPSTRYIVYGLCVNGKIYYVGIGQENSKRAEDRWNWVENQLKRFKREGGLPPGKKRGISKGSGAVIRYMIERGMKGHDIIKLWEGFGREEALRREKSHIKHFLSRGCVLANEAGNPQSASTEQVLHYLGIQ